MQTKVDKIVFGMWAKPNGSTRFVETIKQAGYYVPEVVGGVCEQEAVALMKQFPEKNPEFPRMPFVQALLEPYK
jgi:tRNA(Arg) A34 adenosine deaminase TadA